MESSISVITTTYNCEKYIEHNILSIHGSNSLKCDHIVVDGGSTDGTITILKKHESNFKNLIVEPDDGMYFGIEKGARYVETEIMAWLNSDDIYYPWTLSAVHEIFKTFPEVDWIIGQPSYINQAGQCTKVSSNAGTAYPNYFIRNGWFQPSIAGYLQQESMFWRKSLWDKAGGLNLDYKYAADFDLWTRFAKYAELVSVALPLACFRKRPGQTSVLNEADYLNEVNSICKGLKPYPRFCAFMNRKFETFRILSRLLLWKKCMVITFSDALNIWVKKEMYRPLSRYSLPEVLLAFQSNNRKS